MLTKMKSWIVREGFFAFLICATLGGMGFYTGYVVGWGTGRDWAYKKFLGDSAFFYDNKLVVFMEENQEIEKSLRTKQPDKYSNFLKF